MKESMLSDALCVPELFAWRLLKLVIAIFLGNTQSAECEKEVEKLLKLFELGARM